MRSSRGLRFSSCTIDVPAVPKTCTYISEHHPGLVVGDAHDGVVHNKDVREDDVVARTFLEDFG